MSKVILPPGKKPLATIRRVRDAADRVEDYGKLLEWLLVANFPKPEVEKDQVFLGDYVQRYADKFSEIADVRFALNVYNDIKHTNTKRDRPPERDEIERAAEHLDLAVFELLLLMPWPVQRAVLVDPYVQLAKKCAIAAAIGIALYWLATTVLPAYIERQRTAQDSRPSQSQKEFAQQQWANVERSARETLISIEQLELALSKWEQRWTEITNNSEGRRLANSADALRLLEQLHQRPRPQAEEIKKLRADVEEAMKPVRRAQKDHDYEQTRFDSAEYAFGRIRRRAWDEAAACNSALDTVNQLLSKAASSQPAEIPLQQAIDRLREADRLAKVEAERKAAEEVVRLKAEKAKLVEGRTQDYQKKLAADRAEYRRLRSLAEAPDIREKFQPFLGQGVRFPLVNRRRVSWQYEGGRQPGLPRPIGYAWLKHVGVLDSADAMIAVATSSTNDRGAWPAATTEAETKEYRDRHNLLKEVAPIWHDMGLLGPLPEEPHLPDPDKRAKDLEPFKGEWHCEKYGYDVLIVGSRGVTTWHGESAKMIGSDMIRIETVDGASFQGSHLFRAGNWDQITGEMLSPDRLKLSGGGFTWLLERMASGR